MSRMNVLIVDDEPEISNFIQLKLKLDAPHLSISSVTSGAECIELSGHGLVDCILSDYQMPGMNGMELLMRLRESGDETPFIFVTGQGNEDIARSAFKNGAFDYFTKDIGFAHFPRIINSIEQAIIQRRARIQHERAESELGLEKAKLQSILESISDGISIQDNELRILYQNPAHIALIGDHTGEFCYRAYDRRDEPCQKCPVLLSMQDGTTHSLQKSTEIDGRPAHVELTASPIKNADGNIFASIEIARNVTDRVRAERALLQNKQFLSSVFTSIQDGISILDTEYNIMRVNPTVERWYPHAVPLEGRKCYEAYYGRTEPCELCPSREALATGRPASDTVARIGQHGDTTGWVDLFAFPMLDEQTGIMTGVIEYARDITDRKKAEEEAARTKRTFADIVDAIKFGMVIVGKDRKVRHVNETALKMMGAASEEDVVGKVCHRNICPAEEGRCPILDLGQNVDLSEKTLITADGGRMPILKTVTPVTLDGENLLLETFVDITAIKQAEKKVAEAQEFLQSVLNGAADPIMVIDRDYTVSLMNNAARRMSASPVGKNSWKCYELSHGASYPCSSDDGHECPLELVVASGEPVTVLHEHLSASGETRWIEITASPLKGDSGEIVSIIETSRDITERKTLERERLDLQAMVAHDLKGPLTAMMGYSEILMDAGAGIDPSATADMARSIRANGKRLSAMIESYLTYSRLEDERAKLNASPVELPKLVEEVCREYSELAKSRGIKLVTDSADKVPFAMADRTYLMRAVSNLVENAINYTQEGGTITAGAYASGDELVIRVSDDGPGIEPWEQEKVFEKYYRSSKSAGLKGTGLGLAIVKAVAEAHSGRVELESAPGKGSTFRITIPRLAVE